MEAFQFPFMPSQQKAVSAVEDSDGVYDNNALDRLSGRGQKYNNYGLELRLLCGEVVTCRTGLVVKSWNKTKSISILAFSQ